MALCEATASAQTGYNWLGGIRGGRRVWRIALGRRTGLATGMAAESRSDRGLRMERPTGAPGS